MATKQYRTGVLITGDASGAVKAVNLTDAELKKLNDTQGKTAKGAESMSQRWASAAKGAVAAAGAIATAAVATAGAIVQQAAGQAREVENLSRVANASTDQFQRWAAGARTVQIEQDKLSDILKDMSDRVGDFVSTGGGPMADFFENIAPQVGVTADQFRRLSGPDALQLYVSSLEKANLTQNEMAFYMEAVASDATALLPLLRNNGDAMNAFGDRAAAVGAVLDQQTLAALRHYNDNMDTMRLVTEGARNTLVVGMLPAITQVSDLMVDYSTNTDLVKDASAALNVVLKSLVSVGVVVGAAFESAGKRIGAVAAAMVAAAKGEFGQAWDIIKMGAEDQVAVAEKTLDRLKKLWGDDYADLNRLLIDTEQRKAAVFGRTGQEIAESAKKSAAAEKEFLKEVEAGAKALAKQQEEARKLAEARDKAFGDVTISIDALERELAALKSGEAAHQAVVRELAVEAGMRAALSSGIAANDTEYRRLIETQYDLAQALADEQAAQEATKEAAKAAAEESARVWVEAGNRIDETFGDAWKGAFDNFKDFGARIKEALLDLLGELAHMAITRPILLSLGLTGSGSAFAGGGMGGGGFNLGGLLSTGKTLWNGITGLASGQGLSGFAGLFGGGGVDSLMVPSHLLTREAAQQAAALSDWASGMGSWLAGIGGAIYGWQQNGAKGAIGGGLGGFAGAKGGAALGTAILPGIGTAIGAALGALLGGKLGSKIFGGEYETTRGGIQLGFADEGFDPLAWERQTKSGGMFGSTKRRYRFGDLAPELDEMLNGAYDATVGSVRSLYEQIGLAVEDGALESVRVAMVRIGTSGKSEQTQEEIEAAIAGWFDGLTTALVTSVDSAMSFEALQELAGAITAVNPIMEALGLSLFDVSKDGAWAAKELLRVSGGLEALVAQADYYYANFYTEQERLARTTDQVTAALDSLGYQMTPTREWFRDIVEGLDRTTESGRETFAALMQIAPSFKLVADAAEAAAKQAAEAAAQAQAQARAQLVESVSGVAGNALKQYRDREAALADLNQQLADLDAQIAEATAGLAEGLEPIPQVVEQVAQSVDRLTVSSSQLRSMADNLLSAAAGLRLGNLSPLSAHDRLSVASSQWRAAQQAAAGGDASGLVSALQTYLGEAQSFYTGNSLEYRTIFDEGVRYLESMGAQLTEQADQAARQEAAIAAAARVTAAAQQATTDAVTRNGDLDRLLQERQLIEQQIQSLTAVDSKAILESQLQALVDSSQGIDNVAALLGVLPGQIAAELGGIIGMAVAEYGGTLNADGSSAVVDRLFTEVLSRLPSTQERAYWDAYAQNATTSQLVETFFARFNASGDPSAFLSPYVSQGFARGGIASGPASGYPATLHGTEAVIPLGSGALPLHLDLSPVVAELQSARQESAQLRRQVEDLIVVVERGIERRAGESQRQVGAIERMADTVGRPVVGTVRAVR